MNLPKTARINKNGHLEIGGIDAVELAKKFGTPLFVMDEETIRNKCKQYTDALKDYPNTLAIYASKALSVTGILKVIRYEGFGIDAASEGEIYTAIKAGCDPRIIYFHGNNKTESEITFAIKAKVGRFVVDNFDELKLISKISRKLAIVANIMFRVNPGIEAHTHDFVKTGMTDSKFGISKEQAIEAVDICVKDKYLNFIGLHSHIGSQIFDVKPYEEEVDVLMGFSAEVKQKYGVECEEINVGGGIGIVYTDADTEPDIKAFISGIIKAVKSSAVKYGLKLPKLIMEPGRSIVAEAGITLYTAGCIKEIKGIKKYVIIDGGMSDNPRPILYGSKYDALIANNANAKRIEKVTIAGRACESGDVIIRDYMFPEVNRGDIIAVACTGAYNYAMSSNYNRFYKPAMVMVGKGKAKLILKRESKEDLIRNDL